MCEQGNEKEITLTDGRKKSCDSCIQPFVQMLNNNGYQTAASCCGHGKRPTSIILASGEEIHIFRSWKEGRMVDGLFEPLHPRTHEWKYKVKRFLAKLLLSV